MNYILLFFVGFILFLMAIIDIKFKKIPSIIPTSTIFLLLIYNNYHNLNIYYGVLGFVFALFLFELGEIKGISDIKTIIIISLVLTTIYQFFLFIILLGFIGVFYKYINIQILKSKKISYINILFLTFIILRFIIYFGHY